MWIDPEYNYGPRAAKYLEGLGWLNLLGLNLVGGVIWIWMGERVRHGRNGFRIGAAVVATIHVLLLSVLVINLLLGKRQLTFFEARIEPPLWASVPIGLAITVAHAAPLVWLLAPGTRVAFERRLERGLCPRCNYDLRASLASGRCPECGRAFQAEQAVAQS